MKVKSLSRVRLLATPWTAAYQAPPSMGFARQEYILATQVQFLGRELRSHSMPPLAAASLRSLSSSFSNRSVCSLSLNTCENGLCEALQAS